MAIDALKVKVVGTEKVKRAVKELVKGQHDAFLASLYLEGQDILRLSGKLVPVDFSNLKQTGAVQRVTTKRKALVIISYGGPNAPYAVVQHERMDYRHTAPQSAKYLSIPFNERVRTMGPRVARRMRAFNRANRGVTSPRSGGTTYF